MIYLVVADLCKKCVKVSKCYARYISAIRIRICSHWLDTVGNYILSKVNISRRKWEYKSSIFLLENYGYFLRSKHHIDSIHI